MTNIKKIISATALTSLLSSVPAEATVLGEYIESAYNFVCNDIKSIVDEHDYDVYAPLHAWHNRYTYDHEHTSRYNEDSFGFGLGISHTLEDGDWSGLYAMGFEDSNYHLETFFGYGYQWNWTFGDEDQWRAGIGYTMGLTQRHEYKYIPVPLALPLFGVGYRGLNLQAAYVPGVHNNGNVLFIFARYQFSL